MIRKTALLLMLVSTMTIVAMEKYGEIGHDSLVKPALKASADQTKALSAKQTIVAQMEEFTELSIMISDFNCILFPNRSYLSTPTYNVMTHEVGDIIDQRKTLRKEIIQKMKDIGIKKEEVKKIVEIMDGEFDASKVGDACYYFQHSSLANLLQHLKESQTSAALYFKANHM